MISKINVFPIVADHFSTLRDSRNRFLWPDIVLFYGLPAVVAVALISFGVTIPATVADYIMLGLSILIPLLLNVVVLIYSIKQAALSMKVASPGVHQPAHWDLLCQIYKNLSYSILVASVTVLILGLTKFAGQPFPFNVSKEFLNTFNSVASNAIYGLTYYLLAHTLLTGMMILKRMHVLLTTEMHAQK